MEEHDYMGLKKEDGKVEEEEEEVEEGEGSCEGSLKGTELRLGLPGSESPERVDTAVLTLAPPNGFCGLGSKRVFSDAISASGGVMKWVFSSGGANGSAEGEYRKGGGMGENSDAAVADGPAKVTGVEKKKSHCSSTVRINDRGMVPPVAKAQVVGWPPIRSYRKNSMVSSFPSKNSSNSNDDDLDVDEPGKKQGPSSGCLYVKVSMDGAPYLRKVDLKSYRNYKDLSSALEKMFSCFTIGQCGSTDIFGSSENVLTYEDKDGDWMLVGDVPWDMFTETCKRLRIMKGSDAIGLAPRAMGKSKAQN